MQYFGGKQRIAKHISKYISERIYECDTLAEKLRLQNTFPNTLTTESTHTHTHTTQNPFVVLAI
jgi:hypothetical protein